MTGSPPLPPAPPFRAVATGTAALAVPVAGVFIVLLAFDAIDTMVALVAFVAIAISLGIVVRVHLGRLLEVRAYAEELARAGDAKEPDAAGWGVVGELVSAVHRLGRTLEKRDAELAASELAADAVLEALPDPIVIVDSDERIVGANRAARGLLGQELTGRDLASVLRVPAVLEVVQAALAGESGGAAEFTLAAPVERTMSVRVEALASDGERTAVIALHDLTAIKRADQMRADFIANASHELKTPITTLLGFIETLQGRAGENPEERARFLEIMHGQASRMARLVQDLLSLTRIELTEHAAPEERVSIRAVLGNVIDSLDPKIRKSGASIELDVPDDLPPVIGDTDQLIQVFQNLIDNAIQYGGGRIAVSARAVDRIPGMGGGPRTGPVVAVAVRDWGDGIPREHLSRLTERFFRVDAARSRELGGTGLGLAIVKHVVNRHRGALTIDSELGRGSTFTVFLPAHGEGPVPEAGDGSGDGEDAGAESG